MKFQSMEEAVAAVHSQRTARSLMLQTPCPETEIERLCRESQREFCTQPPARHLDLLRITNGFWENGLHVYASQISDLPPPSNAAVNGFIEATKMYRENFSGYFEQMLVFAEDDAYIYALDVPSGRFRKQAYVEREPSNVFDAFDDLIICAIEPILI